MDYSKYASFEASKKLYKAGIAIPTEAIWHEDSKTLIMLTSDLVLSTLIPYFCAPTLFEIYKIIPEGTILTFKNDNLININCGYKNYAFCKIVPNIIDGLIDLIVWYKNTVYCKSQAETILDNLFISWNTTITDEKNTQHQKEFRNAKIRVTTLLEKALELEGGGK